MVQTTIIMQRAFIHNLMSSFTLWFDHTLLEEGVAFKNVSSSLYASQDPRRSSYQV